MKKANTKKAGRRATGCKSKGVGENIRKFREQKGLSQEQLAEGICSVQMISKIETGKANPSVRKLVQIAERLQVPLHEIYRPDAEDEFPNAVKLELAEVYMLRAELEPAQEMLSQLAQRDDLVEVEQQRWGLLQGKVFNRSGKAQQAIELLQMITKQYETAQNIDDETLCGFYNQLGNAYFRMGEFAKAYSAYEHGYRISIRFPGFNELAANIAYNLGNVGNHLDFHEEAIVYIEKAREFYESVSDLRSMADSYYALAIATEDSNYVSKALRIYESLDMLTMVQSVRQYYAFRITAKQDYKASVRELHSIAVEFSKLNEIGKSIFTLARAVMLCLDQQDIQSARHFLSEATQYKEKLATETPFDVALYYRAKARIHLCLNEYDDCIRYSQKSSELYDTIGMYTDSGDSLELVVEAFQMIGMHEDACKVSRRAYQLLRRSRG